MVQILHSGGNHWITVSTIGVSTPATVRVYDSLNTPLPAHTKKQIASIVHVEGKIDGICKCAVSTILISL